MEREREREREREKEGETDRLLPVDRVRLPGEQVGVLGREAETLRSLQLLTEHHAARVHLDDERPEQINQ